MIAPTDPPMNAPGLVQWGATLKELASRWTAYTAFGTFVLYLLGYLALRFHLTALGVGTDLSVLDERYLFTGARFLVYSLSSIPIALVLVALPAALGYAAYRVLPAATRRALAAAGRRFLASPRALTSAGVVLSVVLVQLVMRRSFELSNVLLAARVPREPELLAALLDRPQLMPSFFSALLAGVVAVATLLIAAVRAAGPERRLTVGRGLLVVMLMIQVLLLPVNYGVLIVDKWLPQVAAMGKEPLPEGGAAWLVWEGKDGVTYLLRRTGNRRALVTVPRQDSTRIEIRGYDSWISVLAPAPPTEEAHAAR